MNNDYNTNENNEKTIEEIIGDKKPKKKRKGLWITILVVALLLFATTLGYIIFYISNNSSGENNYKELSSNVSPTLTADNKPKNVQKKSAENPVDFKKLEKINEDIVGWIKIKDTNIDYPVLRAPKEDYAYYLHRDCYKNYLYAGSIYMERCNMGDFSDRNTILYGHNMMNGTMFADLHKFEDKEFFDKHRYFYIYTKDSIKTYLIYSAYEYDDRHIDNAFNHFGDDKVFKEYIDYSLNPVNAIVSNVRNGAKVTVNDKLVTLSTCTNNRPENRFLVQGVLVKNEQTK